MEDISRRNFLIGTGQVIGAACIVPVLSLEPNKLIATEVPPIELIDPSIRYDIRFLAMGETTIRPAVWPSRFSPFACEISYEQDIHDYGMLPHGRINPLPYLKDLRIDLSLHYTKELDAIQEKLFTGETYKLALNIPAAGASKQLIGDFIVANFDISREV